MTTMMVAVISDAVWMALIAAPVTVLLALIGYLGKKIDNTKTEVTAAGGKVVAVAVEVKAVETLAKGADVKLDKIHTLVNSNMGIQLRLNSTTTSRLAAITKDPADMEAAELAMKMLAEHDASQAVVNGQEH